MTASLRSRMLALVVKSHSGGASSLALEEVPVPELRRGQVLIEVARSPINPNDLLALRKAYEVEKPIGAVAGFEGSGRVVKGAGLMGRTMVGRRVAFAASPGSGAWAELAVAEALQCAPLRSRVTDDEGATMLTNPLTATVLVGRARREGHRAVVQAAAAGALGKMVARLAIARGLTMIHLVRTEAQKKTLVDLGATHVLDTSATGFEAELGARCRELHATLALDPVAGPLTGTLLRALEPGGVVRIFGALSGAPSSFDPDEVVFRGKRLEGFTMYEWLKTTSMLRQLFTVMQVQGALRGALATEIRARVGLHEHEKALDDYERSMSGGKVLFEPSLQPPRPEATTSSV